MKPIAVVIKPKRVVMPAAAEVETVLPGGAALAKDIVNQQLRSIQAQAKAHHGFVDGDTVKAAKDMANVYEVLAKIERDERREDQFGDKLRNMSLEQLDAFERSLAKQ